MRLRSAALTLTACLLITVPGRAHHGKDFLLLETDDMPLPGHVYSIVSGDTLVDPEGRSSAEVTPALLFALGNRVAVEPHFHESRIPGGNWRYDASALDLKYAIGPLPRSDWRSAVSVEVEKPKDTEERSSGHLRLALARTWPTALVAVNLIAGREFARGGKRDYGFGIGALTPLANGDRAGVELVGRFPLSSGVEVVPGYYHSSGNTSLKMGVGLFRSDQTTMGTLHASALQRF